MQIVFPHTYCHNMLPNTHSDATPRKQKNHSSRPETKVGGGAHCSHYLSLSLPFYQSSSRARSLSPSLSEFLSRSRCRSLSLSLSLSLSNSLALAPVVVLSLSLSLLLLLSRARALTLSLSIAPSIYTMHTIINQCACACAQ